MNFLKLLAQTVVLLILLAVGWLAWVYQDHLNPVAEDLVSWYMNWNQEAHWKKQPAGTSAATAPAAEAAPAASATPQTVAATPAAELAAQPAPQAAAAAPTAEPLVKATEATAASPVAAPAAAATPAEPPAADAATVPAPVATDTAAATPAAPPPAAVVAATLESDSSRMGKASQPHLSATVLVAKSAETPTAPSAVVLPQVAAPAAADQFPAATGTPAVPAPAAIVAPPAVAPAPDANQLLASARRAAWAGQFEAAVAAYEQLIKLQPQAADPPGELGNLYYQRERKTEAAAYYERAGLLLVEQGDQTRIWQLLQALRGLDPVRARAVEEKLLARSGK